MSEGNIYTARIDLESFRAQYDREIEPVPGSLFDIVCKDLEIATPRELEQLSESPLDWSELSEKEKIARITFHVLGEVGPGEVYVSNEADLQVRAHTFGIGENGSGRRQFDVVAVSHLDEPDQPYEWVLVPNYSYEYTNIHWMNSDQLIEFYKDRGNLLTEADSVSQFIYDQYCQIES